MGQDVELIIGDKQERIFDHCFNTWNRWRSWLADVCNLELNHEKQNCYSHYLASKDAPFFSLIGKTNSSGIIDKASCKLLYRQFLKYFLVVVRSKKSRTYKWEIEVYKDIMAALRFAILQNGYLQLVC